MQVKNKSNKKLEIYWKVLAFLLPLYVMYGPIPRDGKSLRAHSLWNYLIAGMVFYVILVAVFIIAL